ncbi:MULTISPECIES: alpha/beta fold hydrolase [unclassified Microbacterium]|uniref:alpha/beta fold hydrolase n=1 Tax=unclassified Microbacterium TaxID=2609290 RepID=UPI0021A47E24|nr:MULTISPECIES: alpha/beta hydrolase [unclassified Microbacterium]MCT1363267.1 alpha/beta hydrolase [Microbacterium sp. p3-SID131]MCT1377892.1 alpha/beta hydrolase [Microbacterium sp. p3-SID337]
MSVPSPYAERLSRIPVQRHEVEVRGGSTAYWAYGPDDAETTVIAVHGFRGEHHGLESVLAFLPELRVLAPDLPGFGESAPLPGRRHDLAEYAGWLTDFTAATAPGAVILGHSFGSIVTAAAVARGLETPRLILVNPIGAPALEGPKGIMTRLAVLYYALGAKLPPRIGTALLRNRVIVRVMSVTMAKTRDPELRRFIHDQHDTYFSRFSDREVLHDAFVASVSHDVREFAPSIDVPTLLIAAQKDDITPIEAERALVTLFPDASLVEIAHVGHLIHYETPAEAAGAVRRFLRIPVARGR